MKKETLDSLKEVGNPSLKVAVAMTRESHRRLFQYLLSKPKPDEPSISSLGGPIKTKPRP